ncbi:hypothetical protein AB6D08_20160, partial [Vibrio splendidus]
ITYYRFCFEFPLIRDEPYFMGTWILETLLWAVVTVAVCVAIWGLYLPNILIALGVSVAVSLLLGNSWRS